jgi:hypothetical protein
MSPAKDKHTRGSIDWLAIEHYVVTTPGTTLQDAADKYDVQLRSIYLHGGPSKGNWVEKQHEHMRDAARGMEERLMQVLGEGRVDDGKALSEIQIRLQRAALQLVERLYPPADAPVEIQMEAKRLVSSLTGRDTLRAVTDISRTLTETGRHLRLLAGKSTDIYERVGMPSIDVYIPATLEDAKRAELMGRAAQQALRAAVAGESIDVEGFAMSPAAAYPMVAVSPVRREQTAPMHMDVGL